MIDLTSSFKIFVALLMSLALAGIGRPVLAVDFPVKPITLVVPYPPGGATDVLARIVADKLKDRLGQPIIIMNKPGAGGEIGVDFVRRAAPDGYTLLVTAPNIAVAPFVTKNVTRDTLNDFTHVIMLTEIPFLLVVNAELPVATTAEFISYAKRHTGKLNWGLVGSEDFEVALFMQKARVQIERIRYAGTAPLMIALLSNEVQSIFTTIRPVKEHIKSGKLRALGVTSLARFPLTPDIPTISESGIPGYDGSGTWYGISGPAHMPADITRRLNEEVNAVLTLPEVKAKIADIQFKIVGGPPQTYRDMISRDISRMKEIARDTGIVPQ